MATPFKENIDPAAVERLGTALAQAAAQAGVAFDRARFVRDVVPGLASRELKDRVKHVAAGIEGALPLDPAPLFSLLVEAAGPALPDTTGVAQHWHLWPVLQVVENNGPKDIPAALCALRELTKRWSGEFAIRPLLEADPDQVFAALLDGPGAWVRDPDPHVRRLVSEGTRPRLPWGMRLGALEADPTRNLAVLHALRDDPVEYVRRSVANHLNDLSKVHPARIAALAGEWMHEAPAPRKRLVRHALRTLLKAGDPAALAVLGYEPPQLAPWSVQVATAEVAVGGSLGLRVELRSTGTQPQRLMVDHAVHYRKADGSLRPKVFKWTTLELGPGETRVLERRQSFAPVSTRTLRPGPHAVDVRVNGVVGGAVGFVLVAG
jgi:3-methyladenine DNA glycosylase AlkC